MEAIMSDSWRYRGRNFIRGVALVAIVVATVALAPAAEAYNGRVCLDTERGQLAGVERVSAGGSYQTGIYGTKADVKILATGECQIVDSVYVRSGLGGIEVGYLSGWSNCPGYTSQFYATPVMFFWAIESNGSFADCQVYPTIHPTTGSDPEFMAANGDHDNYWRVYLDGDSLELNGVYLSFTSGYGLIGQERGDSTDPGLGRFHEIQEMGSLGSWSRWDYGSTYLDTDPDYSNWWQYPYVDVIS